MVVNIKYQWLLEYQELDEQIYLLKWKIKKSELELSRWVEGDLANIKLKKDSLASNLEKNIERDIELLNQKEKSMKSLMDMISKFKGLDNKILKMKYINGMSLKDIAEELNYSYQHIMNKHAQIVKVIHFFEEL